MFKWSLLTLVILLFMNSCGRGPVSPVPPQLSTTSTQPGPINLTIRPSPSDRATLTLETPSAATPANKPALPITTPSQPGLPLPIPVLALASDPSDVRAVYALMANLDLYRTRDGGESWQQLPLPARETDIETTQAGDWSKPDPGDLRISPYNPGQLFLRAGGVLYASFDGGESWLELIDEVTTWFVNDVGTRLYAIRSGEAPELYNSMDGGQSWQKIDTAGQASSSGATLFKPDEVLSLVIGNISDAELFVSTASTIFRSPDGGKSWWEQPLVGQSAHPQGIHLFKARAFGTDLYALVQTNLGPYLARFDRGWVSPDQDHWEILTDVGPAGLAAFIPPDASGLSGISALQVDPTNAEKLYLGMANGLLFSRDGGFSWEQHALFRDIPVLRLAFKQGFENELYAGTQSGVMIDQLPEAIVQPELPEFEQRVQIELIAQVGGSLGPYLVDKELVYAAIGPYLTVLDFSEATTTPQVIWRSPALAAEIRTLSIDENHLYVVTSDGQLHRYDRINPRQPELIASIPVPGETRVLTVQGDMAVLVAIRCRAGHCYSRLLTLELSTPFEARVTGFFDLPATYQGMHLVDSLLFVATSNGLLAFDVSADTGLKRLAEYSSYSVRHAVFAGSYAYLGHSDSLEVLDLSGILDHAEPNDIAHLGEVQIDREIGNYPISTFILDDGFIYAFDTFGEFGYCWSSMYIFDVSEPENPVFVTGGEDLPDFACIGEPQEENKRMYVPDWDGLHLLDISDPLKPQPVGLFPSLPRAFSILPYQDEMLYLTTYRADASLYLFELQDPLSPAVSGPLAPGWMSGSVITDTYLVAPAGFNGLQVVDLADPYEPEVVASLTSDEILEPVYLAIAGNYAYVNVRGDQVMIVNLHDPLQPEIIGQYGPASSLEPQVWPSIPAISQPFVYFVETQVVDRQELAWLSVVDVSDPANPRKLGRVAIPGEAQTTSQPVIVGDIAYVSAGKGISIVDVANPSNPQPIAWLDLPGGSFDITYSEPYLLVAGGQSGLWVVDISKPSQPLLVGRYDTPGTCSQVAVVGDVIYVNDGFAGVLLLKIILE